MTRLPALGGIDAPQPDALAVNLDGVAVNHTGAADQLGGGRRLGD